MKKTQESTLALNFSNVLYDALLKLELPFGAYSQANADVLSVSRKTAEPELILIE